jgi:hypothetical protein
MATETENPRHPARDEALKETLQRLARITVREDDTEAVLAHCIGTIEAGVGMMKEKTSPDWTVAFLLSLANAIVEHAEHQCLTAHGG